MDDSSKNKVRENIAYEKSDGLAKKPEPDNLKGIKEASNIGKTAVETINLIEDVESTIGKVAEVLMSKKEDSGSGGGIKGKAAGRKFNPAQIKSQLLKAMPSEKVMRREIEREIKKEIKYLHKKVMRMVRISSGANFFELNNLLGKIRELTGILLKLVKTSLESIKTLWLRYVHGVM